MILKKKTPKKHVVWLLTTSLHFVNFWRRSSPCWIKLGACLLLGKHYSWFSVSNLRTKQSDILQGQAWTERKLMTTLTGREKPWMLLCLALYYRNFIFHPSLHIPSALPSTRSAAEPVRSRREESCQNYGSGPTAGHAVAPQRVSDAGSSSKWNLGMKISLETNHSFSALRVVSNGRNDSTWMLRNSIPCCETHVSVTQSHKNFTVNK